MSIFNRIKSFFAAADEPQERPVEPTYRDRRNAIQALRRERIEALMDEAVICSSNLGDPLIYGKVTEVEEITKENQPVAIVREDETDKEYLILGSMVQRTVEAENMLRNSSAEDAHAFMVDHDVARVSVEDVNRYLDNVES